MISCASWLDPDGSPRRSAMPFWIAEIKKSYDLGRHSAHVDIFIKLSSITRAQALKAEIKVHGSRDSAFVCLRQGGCAYRTDLFRIEWLQKLWLRKVPALVTPELSAMGGISSANHPSSRTPFRTAADLWRSHKND